MEAFYLESYDYLIMRPRQFGVHDHVFQRYFGSDFPPTVELLRNVSLFFVNSNEFLMVPHITSHKVVYIGGVLETGGVEKKQLPAKIEAIFNRAKAGVVLFSFGSLANTTKMGERKRAAFLTAFSRLSDYEFVYKCDDADELMSSSEGVVVPANVHLFKWVPQVEMLHHPKLKAFITHCGLNSLTEAVTAGVPMVGVPIFGDHHYTASIVQSKGLGVYLDITKIENDQVVVDALTEVLTNDM